MHYPEPEAFFGSSFSSPFDSVLGSSGGWESCWCVSLCQADLRKPSFLWDSGDLDDAASWPAFDGV